MLRFEKLTVKAQEALQTRTKLPRAMKIKNYSTASFGGANQSSRRRGAAAAGAIRHTERSAQQRSGTRIGPAAEVQGFTDQRLGRALNDALERAFKEADNFKDEYVSTEHLFLAIAGSDRDAAGKLLKKLGASHEAILQALLVCAGRNGSPRKS